MYYLTLEMWLFYRILFEDSKTSLPPLKMVLMGPLIRDMKMILILDSKIITKFIFNVWLYNFLLCFEIKYNWLPLSAKFY